MTDTEQKLKDLRSILKRLGRAAVSFSGGVDSSLLTALAFQELGDEAIAITVVSPLLSGSERETAKRVAGDIGIRHVEIEMNEVEDPDFASNTPNRCYFCKKMRFVMAMKWAVGHGIPWVLDGTGADDMNDYRPGRKALEEIKTVRSPLLEVGLHKAEIRAISKELGLITWDQPARACLASRLPYGERVTMERLRRIEAAEECLAGMLPRTSQFRVRSHGDLARVEAESEYIPVLVSRSEEICSVFDKIGFKYTTVDLKGYRMGSMNEVLDADVVGA